MLSGPPHSLSRDLSVVRFAAVSAVAVAASLLLSLLLQRSAAHSPEWLPAHAVALLLTGLLRLPARRTGDMLSAMTVYSACTVLANYTLDSFLPVADFFLVNVGTFFFGVTFMQRDRVHAFGRRNVYRMIWFAGLANVLFF